MPSISTLNAGGLLTSTDALKIRTGANPSEHLIVGLENIGTDPVTVLIKGFDPDTEPDLVIPGGRIVLQQQGWTSETRMRLANGAGVWLKASIGNVVRWTIQEDVLSS